MKLKSPYQEVSDPERLLAYVLRFSDICVVFLAAYLAYLLRGTPFGTAASVESYFFFVFLGGSLIVVNTMQLSGAYRAEQLRMPTSLLARVIWGWFWLVVLLIILAALTKTSDTFSRLWFLYWMLLTLTGLVVSRLIVAGQVMVWHNAGKLVRHVLVVGGDDFAWTVAQEALRAKGCKIVGYVAVPGQPQRKGLNIVASLAELQRVCRDEQVEEILVAFKPGEVGVVDRVMDQVSALPVNVRLCPNLKSLNRPVYGLDWIGSQLSLDIWRRPMTDEQVLVKAIEDRVLSFLILLVLFPLMLLVALAIKLDSRGPVFFKQDRSGFSNQTIKVLKFRTMYHLNNSRQSLDQARRNDARVTRIGSFLRRTSLDELPQFINVLRGDMSIVGPRPHALEHEREFHAMVKEYYARQRVKPGITGLAQVNGLRGEVDTPEKLRARVRADLDYIENWSILLDLRIIFMTPLVALIHKNAY